MEDRKSGRRIERRRGEDFALEMETQQLREEVE
jgi:hypothetical protein